MIYRIKLVASNGVEHYIGVQTILDANSATMQALVASPLSTQSTDNHLKIFSEKTGPISLKIGGVEVLVCFNEVQKNAAWLVAEEHQRQYVPDAELVLQVYRDGKWHNCAPPRKIAAAMRGLVSNPLTTTGDALRTSAK